MKHTSCLKCWMLYKSMCYSVLVTVLHPSYVTSYLWSNQCNAQPLKLYLFDALVFYNRINYVHIVLPVLVLLAFTRFNKFLLENHHKWWSNQYQWNKQYIKHECVWNLTIVKTQACKGFKWLVHKQIKILSLFVHVISMEEWKHTHKSGPQL